MGHFIREQGGESSWTFGSGGRAGRYGGAHRCGRVNLHSWGPNNEMLVRKIQCSSYRKAQRKLLQWLKGYNV